MCAIFHAWYLLKNQPSASDCCYNQNWTRHHWNDINSLKRKQYLETWPHVPDDFSKQFQNTKRLKKKKIKNKKKWKNELNIERSKRVSWLWQCQAKLSATYWFKLARTWQWLCWHWHHPHDSPFLLMKKEEPRKLFMTRYFRKYILKLWAKYLNIKFYR